MSLASWRCPHASRPGDARMPRALAMPACLAPWRCPHASRPGDVHMPRALAMPACLAPWQCPHASRPGDEDIKALIEAQVEAQAKEDEEERVVAKAVV
ncbi:hypothetical protein VNO80_06830 [Phaseolus coccineus]|uniref:Uncharacterized protein n=1 Tax=Phaseolus coccineus TaxID=3886 RepID=A0AAN9NMG3_PHACN